MTASVSKDALGDRMKGDYENRTRFYLPRRTNALVSLNCMEMTKALIWLDQGFFNIHLS